MKEKNVIVLNENSSVNFLSRFIETISPSSSEQKKELLQNLSNRE